MVEVKPLAPIFFSRASVAIISINLSILLQLIPRLSRRLTILFNSLSLELIMISFKFSLFKLFNSRMIGRRPNNSLLRPYLTKSSLVILFVSSSIVVELKPIDAFLGACFFSYISENAPVPIKIILEVSIVYCPKPPIRILLLSPSIIFNNSF